MRNRLLGYLYGAFDRSPDAIGVMTLSHANGVVWEIANRTLLVGTTTGQTLASIDLANETVGHVAELLSASGVNVSRLNSEFISLSACILLDGSGSEVVHANTIVGYRSVLLALVDGYATEVQSATDAVPNALEQAMLHSADGDWLEFWGSYFGVPRRAGQDDAHYLGWIITEVMRNRSNKYALENAITDTIGLAVDIFEPWLYMFKLSHSRLSVDHHFQDGNFYTRNVIQPQSLEPVSDWSPILSLLGRDRPAGTIVLSPVWVKPLSVINYSDFTIDSMIESSRGARVSFGSGVLDQAVLDVDPLLLNHTAKPSSYQQGNWEFAWDDRTWAGAVL